MITPTTTTLPSLQTGQSNQQPQSPQPTGLELNASRQFTAWLAETGGSFAFSTYQVGKLFFIGLKNDGSLSVFNRTFSRCMGLCAHNKSLYVSTLHQLWRFEDSLDGTRLHQEHDRFYVPQVGYITGDIDIHDIGVDDQGRILFINTLFSCLATTDEKHSFIPLWKPNFISKLASEDRCHLNGLAMENGKPRFVSSISRSDVADGWREHRRDGGCVIDIESGEIVLDGLSMPHSPRLYQGKLWLLDSGTGRFGYVDLAAGRFEEIAFCPGYMRGLSFIGDYALIGLSQPRHNKSFSGLALDQQLTKRSAQARCGIQVVDLRTGDCAHSLRIEGVIQELYDVVALPGSRRPMALGFQTDEINRTLMIGEA